MAPLNPLTSSTPKFPPSKSLSSKPRPEKAASSSSSFRETAGAEAPATLAPLQAGFEKRTTSAPEIPGMGALVDMLNMDSRSPQEALKDLRESRAYFADLRNKGLQTRSTAGTLTNELIIPILHSANARAPGLNALGCSHESTMTTLLTMLSAGGGQEEGHVRFHLGVMDDFHRIAVDAFRHREGGFTLIAVDSSRETPWAREIGMLQARNPDVIKGVLHIPTPNLVHEEGCRIFAVHTLNALHDYQPYVQSLHRQLYDHGRGRPAPLLSGPGWERKTGNTHFLADAKDAFTLLPGKFFKHIQVMKPKPGETRTVLDEAEARNPALQTEALNKKGQTLRERFAGLNPRRRPESFGRADRTASLDEKRLVLLDRAIAHYEGLARNAKPA